MPEPTLTTSLRELEFVAFDTETTGLTPTLERVVELSGVRFRLDGEIDVYEELVDPQKPIPESASRVHGIREEDVRGKPPIGEALPRFAAFARGSVLLAHNAEFDVGFLAHEAARAGVRLPRLPVIDTVEISRAIRPDLPNHKLETLSRALGCEAPAYHRALADSRTLAACFQQLVEQGLPEASFGELLQRTTGALSFGPDAKLTMWLPPLLRPLEEAMEREDRVTILYEPEGKRQEAREIRPRGWMRRPQATFLIAQCERDRSDRSFRLDWITRAQHAQATLF